MNYCVVIADKAESPMDKVDIIISKIRDAMKRKGMKQHEFAAEMGYGSVHMSNILRKAKGGADSIYFLGKAAEVLEVSLNDLLSIDDLSKQYTYLPDLSGNMSSVAFNTNWLAQFGSDELFVEAMPDESMMPTIKAGDLLLVAKRAAIARDGIYMFKFGENISVRRITLQPNHKIIMHSDNNIIPPTTIQKSELNNMLLGQVVWLGRNA